MKRHACDTFAWRSPFMAESYDGAAYRIGAFKPGKTGEAHHEKLVEYFFDIL